MIKLFVDGMIFGMEAVGGISRVWAEYIPRLASVTDMTLLLPHRAARNAYSAAITPGTSVRVGYFEWPRSVFHVPALRSRILDALYVPSSVSVFHSTFMSYSSRRRTRNVVTVHDMIFELMRGDSWGHEWTIRMRRRAIFAADVIVAISQATRSDLLAVYPAIPASRIVVIHNGVSSFAESSRAAASDGQAVGQLRPYLLYVGRCHRYKNFDLAYDWFRASRVAADLSLIVVGAPPEDARFKEALAQNGQVSFLRHVSDSELAELYRGAVALIFPSRREGFGMPIVEAMALGCPVICSDIPVFHEVAGDAAVFFDPSSTESLEAAVQVVIGSDRDELRKLGRANAARFSWSASANRLLELYRSL
jgi:glycosyltransferase involved in cell wall biosynthesis